MEWKLELNTECMDYRVCFNITPWVCPIIIILPIDKWGMVSFKHIPFDVQTEYLEMPKYYSCIGYKVYIHPKVKNLACM